MNIPTIRESINAKLDLLQENIGTSALTSSGIDTVTDSVAEILNTVNPNHDYPPVNK